MSARPCVLAASGHGMAIRLALARGRPPTPTRRQPTHPLQCNINQFSYCLPQPQHLPPTPEHPRRPKPVIQPQVEVVHPEQLFSTLHFCRGPGRLLRARKSDAVWGDQPFKGIGTGDLQQSLRSTAAHDTRREQWIPSACVWTGNGGYPVLHMPCCAQV